jgi:hypothetical protein
LYRWQIVRIAAPAVRKWGDEYVVHHALSNDTYRLSATAGRLLSDMILMQSDHAEGSRFACSAEDAETLDCLSALAELGLVTEC